MPKLSEEASASLNSPILEKEVLDTIRSLPAYKSPGCDGFSAEYYQAFATILSPHLQKLFNYAASNASFPEEMLQTSIIAKTRLEAGLSSKLQTNFVAKHRI